MPVGRRGWEVPTAGIDSTICEVACHVTTQFRLLYLHENLFVFGYMKNNILQKKKKVKGNILKKKKR